ncbi:hypothetical protein ACIQ2D_06900 [Lysinibacillus sp. NPDC097287]|uniref:hypothetical protein n=1 Tax=Lysinibacillus sp. NPDC097287 TaxID=3364144 RepID=UPI0038032226
MALSISQLAKEHQQFIFAKLKEAEQHLHPSSTEDEELVRRAVFSVRNKSIAFERFNPTTSILYAIVQDVRPASLEIDFARETLICSCPQDKWCRHKVGALLALYQYFDSVQNWSATWRAQKSVQLKTLADERSPESWQTMADEVMKRLLPPGRVLEGYGLSAIRTDALERLRRHMPFEREWQPLYKLFMELTILNTIWRHLNETPGHSFDTPYMKYFVEQCVHGLEDTFSEFNARSRLFATDPFYDALQLIAREFLVERQELFANRLQIYMLLWAVIFYEKPRREQELEAMIVLEHDNSDVSFHAVKLMFYVLLQKEELLQANMTDISIENMSDLFELAIFAKRAGEFASLTTILRTMLPLLGPFLQEVVPVAQRAQYVRNLQNLYEEITLNEDEEASLYSAFGMHGLQPFSFFLIKKERYEEWAALHQVNVSSLSYLEMCGLKDVLQGAPATVLPLYHVYAMSEVEQKSRMNYKQAVRIWKSMRSAAKRAGKTAYFETYMQTIRAEFKRLRALQEEIEKGNLV